MYILCRVVDSARHCLRFNSACLFYSPVPLSSDFSFSFSSPRFPLSWTFFNSVSQYISKKNDGWKQFERKKMSQVRPSWGKVLVYPSKTSCSKYAVGSIKSVKIVLLAEPQSLKLSWIVKRSGISPSKSETVIRSHYDQLNLAVIKVKRNWYSVWHSNSSQRAEI